MATSTATPPHPTGERSYHHTSSAYVLPNDKLEQVRLDRQSAGIAAMLGGRITRAPVQPHQTKMLDIGCGTGGATVALAQQHPDASVYGLDISPMPAATLAAAPSNAQFLEGNFLEVLGRTEDGGGGGAATEERREDAGTTAPAPPFQPSTFTHLYSRMLILGINDWPRFYRTAYALLAPTGSAWLEHHEVDLAWYTSASTTSLISSLSPSSPSASYPPPWSPDPDAPLDADAPISASWAWLREVGARLSAKGFDMRAGTHAASRMRNAGFANVRVEGPFAFTFVPDAQRFPDSVALGEYAREMLGEAFAELVRKVLGNGEVDGGTLEEYREAARRDVVSEPGVHLRYWVTVGRRPAEGEQGM